MNLAELILRPSLGLKFILVQTKNNDSMTKINICLGKKALLMRKHNMRCLLRINKNHHKLSPCMLSLTL